MQIKLSLAASNEISRDSAYRSLGIDIETERQKIFQEEDSYNKAIEEREKETADEQTNKAVLTTRAESLRSEFEKTKTRRQELTSVKEKLVLDQLLEALDKHEDRLTKLEEISGTVDKDV